MKKQVKDMPAKWHKVIAHIALGGLCFQDAMVNVGYSKTYANANGHKIKQDDRFCEALKAKQASIIATSEDIRAKRMQDLSKIIDDKDIQVRDRIAAIQLQGRMSGWLSETIRHETTERQAQLDSVAQREVAMLAAMSLQTMVAPIRKTIPANMVKEPYATDMVKEPYDEGHCDIVDASCDDPVTPQGGAA